MINLSSKIYKYNVTNINPLNDYISEIILESCDKNKLHFLPGQYVYIHMDNDKKLPYSIASAPNSDYIRLLVNNGSDNKIIKFFNKYHNAPISLSDSSGEAYYHRTDNNILAISKGLGIAPILSIISDLADNQAAVEHKKEIVLYHVVSSKTDLVFESHLQNIQQKIKIKYKYFITHGKYDLNDLFKDFISMHTQLTSYDFYVFGSSLFVLDIYKELLPYCKNNFYSDVNIVV